MVFRPQIVFLVGVIAAISLFATVVALAAERALGTSALLTLIGPLTALTPGPVPLEQQASLRFVCKVSTRIGL
jgi:hypothetical protein